MSSSLAVYYVTLTVAVIVVWLVYEIVFREKDS